MYPDIIINFYLLVSVMLFKVGDRDTNESNKINGELKIWVKLAEASRKF